MRLAQDVQTRKALFVEDAFQHPAKGHIGMWSEMIERYSKKGDWVLDPMSGIGTTLIAALQGRNVICVELEQHFVELIPKSWEKMRQQPMMFGALGEVLILRGDARCLPLSSADCVITSPPYDEGLGHSGKATEIDKQKRLVNRIFEGGYTHPAQVDTIVTSPPYEDYTFANDKRFQPPHDSTRLFQRGYTRPAQVDTIVTSPPYGEAENSDRTYQEGSITDAMSRSYRSGVHTTENIGSLKKEAYWGAMRQVYSECYRVLKPSGVIALAIKGFTRKGEYVDLPQQTADMLEELGFTVFDRWTRELAQLSFWRILQQRKGTLDDRLRFEHIIAARK